MRKKFLSTRFAAGAAAAALLFAGTVPSALAYMTDIADTMDNAFTIALDATCELVEKYPPYDNSGANNMVSYEKAVQVINTGFIDEYVRVRLDFTEEAIKNITALSWDGTNFYSVDDYKNHLPSGWTYNDSDGYYYYTPIVESGDWESVKNTLRYDEASGQYFYNDNQNLMSSAMITTPLIRYVKTTFPNPQEMRSYGLNAYSECVPFYFGNDYSSAWSNYLNG